MYDTASLLVGALPTKWLSHRAIPPVWLNCRLGSRLTAQQKTARLGKICALPRWVILPRCRILVKIVCGPWCDLGSCVKPTRPMETLLSTSRCKALAYQKF
jgi:hypothetical protein